MNEKIPGNVEDASIMQDIVTTIGTNLLDDEDCHNQPDGVFTRAPR